MKSKAIRRVKRKMRRSTRQGKTYKGKPRNLNKRKHIPVKKKPIVKTTPTIERPKKKAGFFARIVAKILLKRLKRGNK